MRGVAAAASWLALFVWMGLLAVAADAEDPGHTTVALDVDASTRNTIGDHFTTTDAQRHPSHNASASPVAVQGAALVVGIKTNVLHGAARRQIIRETWGRPDWTRRLGVSVWFIGCRPKFSPADARDRESMQHMIQLEKLTYQDLLIDELRCDAGRLDQNVEFMHFVDAQQSPTTRSFVLVTDDDVFVRLDALLALLQSGKLPHEGLYAGSEGQRAPSPTDRDPTSQRFLPIEVYPMSELPPFVDSAHFVVSRDIVAFIARNRDDLAGIGDLDDVTMALWMLALQVHPVFLETFQVLRPERRECSSYLVSYARLSPTAIRQIHTNLAHGRDLCHNHSFQSWQRDNTSPAATTTKQEVGAMINVTFLWGLEHDLASASLRVHAVIQASEQSRSLMYAPSAEPYNTAFCNRLLNLVRANLSLPAEPTFCAHHRRLLLEFLARPSNDPPSLRAKTAIVRHNLQRSEQDAQLNSTSSIVVTIVLSPMAIYSRVVIECLFTQMYSDRYVMVLNEADLFPESPPPDVFVFSVLDDLKRTSDEDPGPNGVRYAGKYSPTSRLVMVSGETWATHGLDARVTLISTVESPRHAKHLYIPFASSVFGEMVRHYPTQLLSAAPSEPEDSQPRKFCAYLYANCNCPWRENMFDLLSDVAPVDALGACHGAQRAPDPSRRAARYANFFVDDAVDIYRAYKFVVAFENTVAQGYVTEKIVAAFLAGSVPIYYGHSASVARLFNPKAFIDCGPFASLPACADEVRRIHASPLAYQAMRSEPPVRNVSAFFELFSWHPAVFDLIKAEDYPSRAPRLSETLKELLDMD